jgi:hypothetical protein
MTSRDFCYWLQGFFEIADAVTMDRMQVEMVRRHLNLVFKHEIDPSMGGPEKQQALNEIHSAPQSPDKFDPPNFIARC